jgi:hypothetical protein
VIFSCAKCVGNKVPDSPVNVSGRPFIFEPFSNASFRFRSGYWALLCRISATAPLTDTTPYSDYLMARKVKDMVTLSAKQPMQIQRSTFNYDVSYQHQVVQTSKRESRFDN